MERSCHAYSQGVSGWPEVVLQFLVYKFVYKIVPNSMPIKAN